MNCPRCKSSEYSKDGIVNLRPRYKCKKCVYRYPVEKKSDLKSDETKRLALEILGFKAIGRILKISYGSVYKWVKEWGEKVSLPKSTRPIEMVELDEMRTYIMSKKTTVGSGLLLIDLEKGMSILCVETGQHKPLKNFGSKLKI